MQGRLGDSLSLRLADSLSRQTLSRRADCLSLAHEPGLRRRFFKRLWATQEEAFSDSAQDCELLLCTIFERYRATLGHIVLEYEGTVFWSIGAEGFGRWASGLACQVSLPTQQCTVRWAVAEEAVYAV